MMFGDDEKVTSRVRLERNKEEISLAKLFHLRECMSVCLEVALCGVPMEKGVKLGLVEGPSRGPMFQPRRYHRSRVTHAGSYLHTVCALSVANFTLGS